MIFTNSIDTFLMTSIAKTIKVASWSSQVCVSRHRSKASTINLIGFSLLKQLPDSNESKNRTVHQIGAKPTP